MNKNERLKTIFIWVSMVLFAALVLSKYQSEVQKTTFIEFSQFIAAVKSKQIQTVEFKGNNISGYFKPASDADKVGKYFSTYGNTSSELYLKTLDENGIVPVYKENEPGFLQNVLVSLFPMIIFLAIFIFILRLSSQRGMGIGKMDSAYLVPQKSNIRFTDVAGVDEAKQDLTEIVDFLKNPGKFLDIGATFPKGVMLVGPPGTGKTLLAKAVAGEAGVPFFSVSGSNFVEMFVGVGASRVRELFKKARESSPCIVFIDEIDAVGKQRSNLSYSNDERDQTLNQILVEMDGFSGSQGVIVMAASNRMDILDQALLRPGRFDRKVMVSPPDMAGREAILSVHARKKKISPDVNWKIVARGTSGMSGADLEGLVNEAALLAARKNLKEINMEMLESARDKILMGEERRTLVSEKDRIQTAYHEAGHAIVAVALPDLDTLHKVTIVPRGRALGVTQILPDENIVSYSREKALNLVCMIMGGRAAEEIVYNTFTSGASDDLKKATEIVRSMICDWGMSEKFGAMKISYAESAFEQMKSSPKLMEDVDAEIKSVLNSCYEKTKALLTEKRDVLEGVKNLLMEKETILGEEVKTLFKA